MADNVAITAGSGTTIACDEVVDGTLGTVKVQYVKIMDGALDGTSKAAVGTRGIAVDTGRAATGLQSTVAGSATAVTILAANTARVGSSIYNDSTAILYLLNSTSQTPTNALFTVALSPNAYYETPFGYTGIVKGIWASAAGNARVMEYT